MISKNEQERVVQDLLRIQFFNEFMAIKKISQELLQILACPACGGDLVYDEKNQELLCDQSRLAFKVIDGIPVMLIDEARELK